MDTNSEGEISRSCIVLLSPITSQAMPFHSSEIFWTITWRSCENSSMRFSRFCLSWIMAESDDLVSSTAFWAVLIVLSSGAFCSSLARLGWSRAPHTGQGSPGISEAASIPAWAFRISSLMRSRFRSAIVSSWSVRRIESSASRILRKVSTRWASIFSFCSIQVSIRFNASSAMTILWNNSCAKGSLCMAFSISVMLDLSWPISFCRYSQSCKVASSLCITCLRSLSHCSFWFHAFTAFWYNATLRWRLSYFFRTMGSPFCIFLISIPSASSLESSVPVCKDSERSSINSS